MLYKVAHILRDKFPFIWDVVDILNSALFSIRFGSKLQSVEEKAFEDFGNGYRVVRLRDIPTEKLVEFFAHQPEEAFRFFKPHGFDKVSIAKLQHNKSFLAYALMDMDTAGTPTGIVGYCFLRSYFHGVGYRGRMVGIDYRGRGLGTLMNKLMNRIGFGIGLRLFESVNKENVASYRSALSASGVKVIEEKENNELILEIINSDNMTVNQTINPQIRGGVQGADNQ